MYRKTFVEINKQNLEYNIKTLLHDYPNYYYYIGVVKGNAYGHGVESVKVLIDSGINYLAVSTLEEATNLRDAGITIPILLLQPIHLADISEAIKNNITVTLSDFEYFKNLSALQFGGELKVHLKINSGFNRLGVSDKNQVKEIFETLHQNSSFKLEGIYTHFATSGRSDLRWSKQLKAFQEITSLINLKEIPIVHLDRSASLFAHAKIDFCTGARLGVSMFGCNGKPAETKGLKSWLKNKIKPAQKMFPYPILKPAFSLYAEVIEIKKVKKGEFVGYGSTFQTTQDSYVACVSVGYADGFMRKNKNGFVAVNGNKYQIISVDMGIMTVLVDDKVKVSDKVELIGENISAKEIATRCGTTVYEILCSIKESVPRILK